MDSMDINASVHTRNSFVAAAVALYEWAFKGLFTRHVKFNFFGAMHSNHCHSHMYMDGPQNLFCMNGFQAK